MKRLMLSILGGLIFPLLYAATVGPLSTNIQNSRLRELASFPIRWPVITLEYFLPPNSFPFKRGSEVFLILFIVLSDVFLYSFVTYILLWQFVEEKPQQSEFPPEPRDLFNSTFRLL